VIDFRDRRFHKLLALAGPAMLSMGISELNHMIDHALASGLNPGDISAMSYAYRLITFLLGVLMVPLTTVMFSKMSRLAAARDEKGMLEALRSAILSKPKWHGELSYTERSHAARNMNQIGG
jgi:putative peptidoglycan lipid II flippase